MINFERSRGLTRRVFENCVIALATSATIAASVFVPASAIGCTIWTTRSGAELHLANEAAVPYYIHVDGSADVPTEEAFDAIKGAFDAWSQVLCGEDAAALQFEYVGTSDTDPLNFDPGLFRDEKNLVSFVNSDWPADPSVIAIPLVQWDNETGTIIEFGIALNDEFTDWSTNPEGEPGTFDIQSVMMREVGLIMGLGNSDVEGAVMSPSFAEGSVGKRTMGNDDVAAVCDLYAPERTDWLTTPDESACEREAHPSVRPSNSNTTSSNMTSSNMTSSNTTSSNTTGGTTSTTPGGIGEACSTNAGCEDGLTCGCPESLGSCATSICYQPMTDAPAGGSDVQLGGCGCSLAGPARPPSAALLLTFAAAALVVRRRAGRS